MPADTIADALRCIHQQFDGYRLLIARTLPPDADKFLQRIPSEYDTDDHCALSQECIQDAVQLVETCAHKIVQASPDLPALFYALQHCATGGRSAGQFLEDFIEDGFPMSFRMHRGDMIEFLSLAIRDHITVFVEDVMEELRSAAPLN
ncbi:hypothetical protein FJZ27_04130 [Candidatus Peribacteria bacterium]|nr:hypothetical protein [Candidatus Peribacteria bacterium]